jgi:sugar phosphate isomerase/epimerase
MADSHDRRSFLATLGAAAVALAASRPEALVAGRRKLKRVGIQLYTLRKQMEKDLPDTLAHVAQIGYREVEFAGYFGRSPDEIRALLQRNKLSSPSSHVPYPTDMTAWRKTVADAKTAGHQYVTVAWTPDEMRTRPGGFKAVADDFNKAADEARKAGLRFAYHNHDYELKAPNGGELPFETLLANTDPKLVTYEMDLYWMVKGGADPIAYFKKYPGRFTLVHVKDATAAPERKMADVGQGTIDFPSIFGYDEKHGSHIAHAFVERDDATDLPDPFAAARTSYEYLSSMNY